MLTALRKHTKSFVVKILAGLLILSFAVWGVGDMFGPGYSDSAVIEVGEFEVGIPEFENSIRRELTRLRPVLGDALTFEQARSIGVVDSLIQREINDAAIFLAARKLGITISDEIVSADIRTDPAFQGLGGFDRDRFNRALYDNNMSENYYVDHTRRFLGRNAVIQSVGNASAPLALVDSVYRFRQEKRTVASVAIADAIQPAIADPDAATLAKYHRDNAVRFTTPQYRELTVVRLEAAKLADDIAVTDDDIQTAYEAREDEFTTPASREVKQMILTSEADAKKAAAALAGGREFADVAKEIANMDAAALELGRMTRGQLLPELADTVFALADGATSKPVRSPLGWHIFRVTGIDAGHTRTIADVRDELKKAIAHEEAIDSMFEIANKLEDSLGGGATLEEAAAQLDLTVLKIPAIDADGRDAAGRPVEDRPGGDFLRVAFDTEDGADSPMQETDADGYFVLRVDKVTQPYLRPLETIKPAVIAAWKAERRAEAAKAAAEGVIEKLKGGESLETIAKAMGLDVKQSPPFTRAPEGDDIGLPQSLIAEIFTLEPDGAAMARASDGYVVARLGKIVPVDPTLDMDGIQELSTEVKSSMERDLLVQFARALRDRFGVKVNRQAVDELFAGRPAVRL